MRWKKVFPEENKYYETGNGILYCGDCFEIVKKFPQNYFDLILTDPPYQISREHNFDIMKRTGTYFGDWDIFNIKNWQHLVKVVNRNGSIISFMAFEQYGEFVKIINENDFEIKDKLIWEKTNPFPRNRDRRYIPNIELIIWAVRKNAKWIFNRQNKKYESCVLRFPSESGVKFERFHPTQKPLKLIEYLLRIHTNDNNIILDPFAGSGTTAVACEKLNRRWIGIEINPEYCEIAKKRIEKATRQNKLFKGS